MPLPSASESAARRVGRVGGDLDRLLIEHMLEGGRLPSEGQFRAQVADHVAAAVEAAMLDIDSDTPAELIAAAIDATLAELVVLWRRARRDAAGRRRRIERAPASRVPEDEPRRLASLPRLAAVFGFAAAVAHVTRRGQRVPRDRMRQAAARAGQPLPPRLEAILKAAVRTAAATRRNERAADVVDERGGDWVLFIRDALIGDDAPCVRVDRRYATPVWLRRHPVEHPNCTREGRPVRLPPGERVTLLR